MLADNSYMKCNVCEHIIYWYFKLNFEYIFMIKNGTYKNPFKNSITYLYFGTKEQLLVVEKRIFT